MKFIIDSANVSDIKKLLDCDFTEGITTNPSILYKEKKNRDQLIVDIHEASRQTLFVQLVGKSADEMVADYKHLVSLFKKHDIDYIIKIAINREGLIAIKKIRELKEDERFLGTTIYNSAQAILAVTVGCEYIAPYYNRMIVNGIDPNQVIAETRDFIEDHGAKTIIVAASLKNKKQVVDALVSGAHTCTIDTGLLEAMMFDDFVERDLRAFEKDHVETLKIK